MNARFASPLCSLSSLHIAVLLMLSLLFCRPAAAAGNDLDQLIALSGLEDQLAVADPTAGEAFASEFERSSGLELGPEFRAVVNDFFASVDFLGPIRAQLAQGLRSRQIKTLNRWYKTELGREIARLELQAQAPEQVERMMAQVNSLVSDADAMARAQALDELLGSTDQLLQTMELTQIAMLDGMLAGPQVPAEVKEQLVAEIRQTVADSRPEMAQFSQAMMIYTYRSLSDADFDRYLAFLAKPASRRFYELVVEASVATASAEYAVLGQRVADFLKAWGERQQAVEPADAGPI